MGVQAALVGQLVGGTLLVWVTGGKARAVAEGVILLYKLHLLLLGTSASFPEAVFTLFPIWGKIFPLICCVRWKAKYWRGEKDPQQPAFSIYSGDFYNDSQCWRGQ